jgi:hypothetical protein
LIKAVIGVWKGQGQSFDRLRMKLQLVLGVQDVGARGQMHEESEMTTSFSKLDRI